MSANEAHRIFTVYERPADFPTGYLVRGWTIYAGDPQPVPDSIAQRFGDLQAARRSIPEGLHRLERAISGATVAFAANDSSIREVWL